MVSVFSTLSRKCFLFLCCLLLSGCVGLPDGVTPVGQFELQRYLGTWYEIARLDHSFERGLNNVTATYAKRDDGGVAVINRGYSVDRQQWKEATGKAYFVEDEDTGYLKVSFFGPFYGAYVIFDLDRENYRYAFVSGPSTDFLWLLARNPTVEAELIERFKSTAATLGFDTEQLILVDHDDQ